jgi:hypothetical protein
MNTPHVVKHKTGYWWFVMAVTGLLSLAFNLWMVIDPPEGVSPGQAATNAGLGVLAHGCPVLLSALVSHGFSTPLLGKWERRIIIVIFLAFMGVSISTQAELLMGALGEVGGWVMPVGIDVIALLALRAILTAHRLNREAAEKADMERDMAELAARMRPAIEEDIRREWEGRLPALREDIARDIAPAIARDIRPAIAAEVRRDIAAEHADILAAERRDMSLALETKERDMKIRYEVVREEDRTALEAKLRDEFVERWNAAEAGLRTEISAGLKAELTTGGRAGGRKAIEAVPDATLQLTAAERHALAVKLLSDNPTLGPTELKDRLGCSAKQAGRIKQKVLNEMGLSGGDPDDADDEQDESTAPGVKHLRRVV